jgi:hypothetical protein
VESLKSGIPARNCEQIRGVQKFPESHFGPSARCPLSAQKQPNFTFSAFALAAVKVFSQKML